MRRIGEDAGITAGSIFHHFPGGKRELYEAMLADITDTLMHQVIGRAAANAGLSATESIVRMLSTFWDYFEEHPDYATVILLITTGMDQQFVAKLEHHRVAMVSMARQLLEAAQARGEVALVDVDRFFLFSSSTMLMIHGARAMPAFLLRDPDRSRLKDAYLADVRAMLEP